MCGQPSSPRGNKRDRRTLDGDSSDEENDKDQEGDPQAKKSKHSDPTDEAGAEPARVETAAKQPRGRKKANGDNQKNGIVKVAKEADKEEQEMSPKRKRGRPKGSGTKANNASAEASDVSASKARKQEGSSEKGKGKQHLLDKVFSPKELSDSSPRRSSALKLAAAEALVKSDGHEARKTASGREKVLPLLPFHRQSPLNVSNSLSRNGPSSK